MTHIVLRGLTEFLHQLRDFLVARAILHRLRQPILRPLHPGQSIVEITLFERQSQLPEHQSDVIAHLGGELCVQCGLKPPQDRPKPQVIGFLVKQRVIGPMADGTQQLRDAWAICARPQKITPLLDQSRGQRIKEPARWQVKGDAGWRTGLPRRIQNIYRQGDRQMRPDMIAEILDQCLVKRIPRAR